ncbi:MAG: hypothetical protein ACEQSL_06260 [Sediminibacterium sp.]
MPENVTELIVKYKADISDLQAKVGQIESTLKKTEVAAAGAGKKTTEAFKEAGEGANFATNAFKKIGAAIVAAFAVEKIIEFGKESVKAFQEAELNAQKLKSAVSSNGGLQSDFENLIKQSQELQKTTIFSDDSIQQAQTLALQFGLTADQVENLIPLITDFASATGQDLNQALEGVLRGIEGNAKALKIYGIQVDSNNTKAQNFASIQEQITKKFAGQAQVVGETSAGALKKLGNAYDDLKERIGGFLAPAVAGFAKLASASLEAFNPKISENLEAEKIALEQATIKLSTLTEGTKERSLAIDVMEAQYPSFIGHINGEELSNQQLANALKKVNDQLVLKIALAKGDEGVAEANKKVAEQALLISEREAARVEDLRVALSFLNVQERERFEMATSGLSLQEKISQILKLNAPLLNAGISPAIRAGKEELIRSLLDLENRSKVAIKDNADLKKAEDELAIAVKKRADEENRLRQILNLVDDEQKNGNTGIPAKEAAALARLKNISKLTKNELLEIQKTLSEFGDLNAQDAIKIINDELDVRKKAGEKELQNRQQALEELHALEQKISDENLKTRSAEKSKVLEIERTKQIQLRDLVQKFADANGGTFDEIIKEFNDTGTINLDKVKEQLATTKAPTGEIDKFNVAVANVNNTFDTLIKKETDAFNIKNLKEDLQATLDSIDFGAENQTFTITKKFQETSSTLGEDARLKAEDELQLQLLGIQTDADKKKLEETQKTNNEIIKIDASQVLPTLSIEQQITADQKKELDQREKNKQDAAKKDAELAAKRIELEKQVRDAIISGVEQITTDIIANSFTEQSQAIEDAKNEEVKSIDEAITANENARKSDIIGRKEYEATQKKLLKDREDAQNKAAKKEKDLKRQQFEADKIAASAKALIGAAVQSAENIELTELYFALAAVQIALINAQPNPYKRGTKKSKQGYNLQPA